MNNIVWVSVAAPGEGKGHPPQKIVLSPPGAPDLSETKKIITIFLYKVVSQN